MTQLPLQDLGKILLVAGIFLSLLGVVLLFSGKIPYIGRLPGDIIFRRRNFTFYFPITTLIILNLLVLLAVYLFRR
ncbi:MAG: DUF2905 domain-containing protein [Calditrichia bacterium]